MHFTAETANTAHKLPQPHPSGLLEKALLGISAFPLSPDKALEPLQVFWGEAVNQSWHEK